MKGTRLVRGNEILPFPTAWTDLESSMLSNVSQRKANTTRFHSLWQFNKQNNEQRGKRASERDKAKKETLNFREQSGSYQRGMAGWGNNVMGIESTLIMMNTEYTELWNLNLGYT